MNLKRISIGVIGIATVLTLLFFANFSGDQEKINADTSIAPFKTEKEVTEESMQGKKVYAEPTLEMWSNAINMANGQKHSDNQLQKWIIRMIMIEKVEGTTSHNLDDIVQKAKERYAYEKAWLELATQEYGVTYTDEEVDAWIANGPDQSPTQGMKNQAEALNLSLKEMNHVYDRDFYVKWVVWEKLRPILAEKYNVDLSPGVVLKDQSESPNATLVNHYKSEIDEYMK